MKSKLFLTSLTAIAIAMPAMAETFPSGGLMQENKTYTEAANYDNMGVYTGEVSANAEYEWDIITVNPGYYVPANSTTAAQCTTGNYCEGIPENQQARTPHYQSTVQGLSQCPANYSNSAAGSDASTDCYRTCTTADVSHSTAVTGAMYYNGTSGDGVNACEPTSNGCANGYHYKAAVTAPDLTTIIGVTQNGTGSGSGTTFSVTYSGKGTITGKAQCSTRGVENKWYLNNNTFASDHYTENLPDSTGEYCYCQLDSWSPVNDSAQSLSAPWVFLHDGLVGNCATDCAYNCGSFLDTAAPNPLAFRAAMFGSLQSSPAMCEANTITITWNGASQTDIDANNAGTATYDGDIRTPRAAEQITGKTFKGWKFVKPTTPSQGD